jgi:hypothetical protein
MGKFTLIADEAGAKIPAEFRFSDTNPDTGRPYHRSRWRDLPEFVTFIALFDLNIPRDEWDIRVEDGEVAEVIDVDRPHSNARWLGARRSGRVTLIGDWTPCPGMERVPGWGI